MNVVKCSNGHFFDGDTYQVCPHCGASVAPVNQPDDRGTPERRRGFFGGYKSKAVPVQPQQQVSFQQQNNNTFGRGNDPTVAFAQISVAPSNSNETVDNTPPAPVQNISDSEAAAPSPSGSDLNAISHNDPPSVIPADNNSFVNTEKTPDPIDQNKIPEEKSIVQPTSLIDAVKQASANSEGKTMSYFSTVTGGGDKNKDSEKTAPRAVDPDVGWLVCIHGEHFGESFNIKSGMNSVGRSENNRIVLNRDQSISREKHALITYEPKHRKFYVKPGDSSGLTYLNDEYITETKQISRGDIIELGNSKFIFIPLCCDSFTWEDYIKR